MLFAQAHGVISACGKHLQDSPIISQDPGTILKVFFLCVYVCFLSQTDADLRGKHDADFFHSRQTVSFQQMIWYGNAEFVDKSPCCRADAGASSISIG